MLSRTLRLTRKSDIDRVFRRGRSVAARQFAFKYLPNSSDSARVAVLVGTKLAKRAVHRNRIKRRLREIIRLNFDKVPQGIDLLIIARDLKLRDTDWPALTEQVVALLLKIKL